MTSFISEIDKLSCMHRSEVFPQACILRSNQLQACVETNAVPKKINYAFFKITSKCNSDCAYCEHAISRSKDKVSISLDDIKGVIRQLGEFGVTACSLSGGEPLVYGYIDEAVAEMKSYGIEPILLTNGILLPQKIEQLYNAGLRYVIMSLDSFEPAHYSKTRGVAFDAVMNAYNCMVKFKNRHSDFIFRITTVISRENLNDAVAVVERADSDGVGVQFTPYHNFINKNDDMGVHDAEALNKLVRQLIDLKLHGKLICNSQEYLNFFGQFFQTGKRVPDNYQCKCGYNAVYIRSNLDVRSCWSTSLPSLGNLKKNSLSGIWNSEEYSVQRQKMLHCNCEGCWLLCTAEFNIHHEKYLKVQV